MALVISFTAGSSSNFALNSYWRMRRTSGSWTGSAKEGLEVLRPTTQNGGLVCKKHLSMGNAQGTLDSVNWAIHCLESFVEAFVVTLVSVLLSFLCEIGPLLILDLSKLALEDATNETEGSPPHRT